MLLQGINFPLAMLGFEAILYDVFTQDFGLSQKDVEEDYFTGPAFLPWHWMGNLDSW